MLEKKKASVARRETCEVPRASHQKDLTSSPNREASEAFNKLN